MNGPTTSDLGLIVPEMILVGTALALMLVARRIRTSPAAAVVTVVAALAAAFFAAWGAGFAGWASGDEIGFSG